MVSGFENFDNIFDNLFEQKSEEISAHLNRKLMISMVGDVNCGKSSTINKLMKEDVVSVGASLERQKK